MPKKNITSTQIHLPFTEIRDDLIVMKDGTLRAIILVSSLNFALKGEEEQEAIIQGYIQFLNSLDFTLQIVIQSRKLNIETYLHDLEKLEKAQKNELLKLQTNDYRKFVIDLVQLADIMAKRFYVIVPYEPIKSTKRKNYFVRLQEAFSPIRTIKLNTKTYGKYREELDRRISFALGGLSSLGLNAVQLKTADIIALLYNTYNPKINENQKLEDLNSIRIEEDNG